MLCMELPKIESMPQPEAKQATAHHAPARIRLMLLDDHLLFRESLGRFLASEEDLELVAACTTPAEALKNLKRSEPDVVLLDMEIAKEFILCARKTRHQGKYLVLASAVDANASAEVLKYGASGVFLTSDSPNRLMQAIRLVASGEAWLDRKVVQFLAERYPRFEARWKGNLSEREQYVLRGVVDGLSNRRIGTQIGVSESTIKATLQQLFKKAGVRTRSQLVRIALEGSPLESPGLKGAAMNGSADGCPR
jgi:two-component system, NarL family, nitrate/nitrite response regulator NarL